MIFGARGGGPVRGEDGESRGDTSEVKAPIPAAGAVGPVKSPRRPRSLLGWLVAAVTWAVVASVVAAILFAGRGDLNGEVEGGARPPASRRRWRSAGRRAGPASGPCVCGRTSSYPQEVDRGSRRSGRSSGSKTSGESGAERPKRASARVQRCSSLPPQDEPGRGLAEGRAGAPVVPFLTSNPERVVAALDAMERGPLSEAVQHSLEEVPPGERVRGALEPQHRDADPSEVLVAEPVRLARRMERVPHEHEAGRIEVAIGHHHRRDPSAHRLAAGPDRFAELDAASERRGPSRAKQRLPVGASPLGL